MRPGASEQTVTLTATFTFQYTNDLTGTETPITLSKVFTVTVPPVSGEQADAIRARLTEKLDAGFARAGLIDAVTGEPLACDAESGVYTAVNDIQLPTTRDFGVDGKVQPVVLASDDEEVLVVPGVSNAARIAVYRPAVGEPAADASFTVTLFDRQTSVSVSKTFSVRVPALTQEEIDSELQLMAEVKAHYFDGLRGRNTAENSITQNLTPFQEVYAQDGQLVRAYKNRELTGRGIVPTALEGWQELERWRLFRSDNPGVIADETLQVTRAKNPKAVTIDSALSSQTLGRYGERYQSDPVKYAAYAGCSGLWYQPVSVSLLVRGTADPQSTDAVREQITASFALCWDDGRTLLQESVTKVEPLTVYDVFRTVLDQNGYTYNGGSYVRYVQQPDGTKLSELEEGSGSGWMYRVNGKIPNVTMAKYTLKDGDSVVFFYTTDYRQETGYSGGGWSQPEQPAQPAEETCPFTDLTGHWAQAEVEKAWRAGLVSGMTGTSFAPDAPFDRAMAVTVLWRMAGSPKPERAAAFSDMPAGAWYADAVAWAADAGVVKGMSGESFAPAVPVTREQLAAMLYRYVQLQDRGYTGAWMFPLDVPDRADIAGYAYEPVCWLSMNGVLNGRADGRIDPKGTATRAEAAVLYLRLSDKLA